MITNKPEEELRGRCDMLFCMIQFKVTEAELIDDRLYYDHMNKHIALKRCAHVKYVTKNVITLVMTNGGLITMRVPYDWLIMLPRWIAYIRQIPLWQVTPSKSFDAQSWAKKQVNGLEHQWNLVYLRYCPDTGVLMYYADEMRREEPLGQINVQHTEQVDNVLKIGHWRLKFETVSLCKAWKRTLKFKEDKPKNVSPRSSNKLDDKRLIDAARNRYVGRGRRRQSIGDEWEDSDEDEEAAHFERVMELLNKMKHV
jgi:hypothetical protein